MVFLLPVKRSGGRAGVDPRKVLQPAGGDDEDEDDEDEMTLRVNSRQLLFLSTQETSANFQKEGTLRVGRQHRDANTETLRRRATHLRTLINTHATTAAGGDAQHTHAVTHAVTHCSDEAHRRPEEDGAGNEKRGGGGAGGEEEQEERRRRSSAVFQSSSGGDCRQVSPLRQSVSRSRWETRRQICGLNELRPMIEDVARQRSFLGFTSFSLRDLLRSEEPHLSLSLRTMDGVSEVGEVMVSRLQVEGESDSTTPPEHKCPALCDSLHTSVHDKENSPMMRAVLCAQVCKVYRFQTEDQRWLLVREQMSETPLSFSLPKQLLSALIQEHRNRMQQVKELGDLSPHWDGLRHDVVNHCNHLIGCYQETLDELDKLSVSTCFKSSGSKSDRHLQFVPTNLHVQRMEVTDPDSTGVWYEVITVGAPADHHQSFKHGGLKRLLRKHTLHRNSSVSYSQDESSRARELLASVAQLQPLVFGLAEELLSVSLELNAARLQRVLDSLTQQTEQFVHALKDELVKSALLAIHNQRSSDCDGSHVHSNGLLCDNTPASHEEGEDAGQRDSEYDEEEWASWRQSVGQRRHEPQLHHRHGRPASGARGPPTGADVTNGGRKLSEHRLLAGAAAPPGAHAQGLRARGGGDGPSRHDLRGPPGGGVTNCRSGTGTHRPEAPRRLQPGALSGRVRLRVEAVWRVFLFVRFRFGDSSMQERVNQQSCERLKAYCQTLRDKLPDMAGIQSLSDLLSSLDRSVEAKKRKNVEVLWIAAAMLGCYTQPGFTVCGLDSGERPSGLRSSGLPPCLAPKAPRRHLYPVAFLLVTSHLLVLWLILSLVILLEKYQ
ncbi:Type II inositol 3,4-bisphosphate 4-phosphatase [Larimichthys crocea]|uniref:Uncharacterized protein n=1 Tax=Larimichthys crocea TaxID=215358 RepID=A0ACD3Q682_LARCR|nr:Type II inositol 3,4-bisphosphate 4-phosphatase [Larimichthys crocea]